MPYGEIHPKARYVLGADIARMGQDETVMIVIEEPFDEPGKYYVVYIDVIKHKAVTEAIGRIVYLDRKFQFEAIYIDTTGLGAGVTDVCREQLGFKVKEFNFTVKSKEDIYSNLKVLFEKNRLKIPNNKKLIYQLLDLKYEVGSTGHLKIHHSEKGHDDYPDALALAAIHFKPTRISSYRPMLA